MVDAGGVVAGPAPVEADADGDAGPGQVADAGGGEQGGVGLESDAHPGGGGDAAADQGGEGGEAVGAGQQGFPAVQDEGDGGQPVGGGVFGDPVGGQREHRVGGGGRAVAPAGVGALVEIAVAAGQVAPPVHLHDELAEGIRGSGVRGRARRAR